MSIPVILVVACNCLVLFFFSFFAVGGNGSAAGICGVWLIGFPWIAAFAFVAYQQCARGESSAAFRTAVNTLPYGYVAFIALWLVGSILGID